MSSPEHGARRSESLPSLASLRATAASLAPRAAGARRAWLGAWFVALGCAAGTLLAQGDGAARREVRPLAPAFKTNDAGERTAWLAERVTVVVDPSVSALAPGAYDAAVRGFGAWLGSGHFLPGLTFEQGSTSAANPAYDGRSTVSFAVLGQPGHERDVAYTVTYVDADTAEILEADIVLNAAYPFEVLDEHAMQGIDRGESCRAEHADARCRAGYDIQNVIAHEAGHFFGLGEDRDDHAATMFRCTGRCEIHKRELEASDAASIAELYGTRVVSRTTPVCGVGAPAGRGQGLTIAASALLLGAVLRRRRGAAPR